MSLDFVKNLQKVANVGYTQSNTLNITNKFITINSIKKEIDFEYAYGTDILTAKPLKIRLSTIDETAADLIKMGMENNQQSAMTKVKNIYAGSKPRETLLIKNKKRKPKYIFFDRCFFIGHENGVDIYRSHWANTIPDALSMEVITGYTNIKCFDDRKEKGRIRAWASMIEYSRQLNNTKETNLNIIKYALRPSMGKKNNCMREGRANIEIKSSSGIVTSFHIPQKYEKRTGIDSQNQPSEFYHPCAEDDSLKSFIEFDSTQASTQNISKDILKVVLHVFCGYNYDETKLLSPEQEYKIMLENLKNKLISGEYTVNVTSSRIHRFGSETLNELLPSGSYNPLKIFTKTRNIEQQVELEDAFVPMVIFLQIAPTGKRSIVFYKRLNYDLKGHGEPKTLNELTSNIDNIMPISKINLNN